MVKDLIVHAKRSAAGFPRTIWEIYREFPPTVIEALTPRTNDDDDDVLVNLL